MRVSVSLAVVVLTACSSSHLTAADAGGVDAARFDAASIDAASAPDAFLFPVDTAPIPPMHDSGVPMPPPGAVICGGVTCAAGEMCCQLTLRCFDPADASACALPPGTTDPHACASSADCAVGELCSVPAHETAAACGGTVGECTAPLPASECGGFGDGVCGCDGRTYPDPCAASRAGVRVSFGFPCGTDATASSTYACDADHTICPMGRHCDTAAGQCLPDVPTVACGTDAQCPSGYSCCGIVGLCMPTSEPERCFVPPEGTRFPCVDNADCAALDPILSLGDDFYCGIGAGCGTPGGCTYFEDRCGGALAPVCGCDGTSYSNECWARMAHVRITHDGMCP